MQGLIHKYAQKLVEAGLAEPGAPVVGGLDADLVWNQQSPVCSELEKVFHALNINSLLFSEPAEPYRSIIDYLARHSDGKAIQPTDCETRTMMHDLPIADLFNAETIIYALKRRKSVIIPGQGIVTWGIVSPEQAFIFFSSVCFACFVKFFADYLSDARSRRLTAAQKTVFDRVICHLDELPPQAPPLRRGPFLTEEAVHAALIEAGRLTVRYRLVDSFFGNLSYRCGDTLYISQTGSSLDELEGCIDPCPLDGSSCAAITASSELTAHRQIVMNTDRNAILHGHPKFSVILSMYCEDTECSLKGECHRRCNKNRYIEDIPIVPGEVGTGPFGLCHTLPPAIKNRRGAIVYGHGLFTTATHDFNEAFTNLLQIERQCRDFYFTTI